MCVCVEEELSPPSNTESGGQKQRARKRHQDIAASFFFLFVWLRRCEKMLIMEEKTVIFINCRPVEIYLLVFDNALVCI